MFRKKQAKISANNALVEIVHIDTGYGEKCPDFEKVRIRKNIAVAHKFTDWEMKKIERFHTKIQRNILKQDKALVSASRHNCQGRRPAEPFGWCC